MSKENFQQKFTVTPRIGDNRDECLRDAHRKTLEVGTSDRTENEIKKSNQGKTYDKNR